MKYPSVFFRSLPTCRPFLSALTLLVVDSTLVLIEPSAASAYDAQRKAAFQAVQAITPLREGDTTGGTTSGTVAAKPQRASILGPKKHRFYANVQLDPIIAKKQFSDIVDEVLLQFASNPGVAVRVTVDNRAITQPKSAVLLPRSRVTNTTRL